MGIVSWARSRFSGKTECRGFDLAGKERRQVVPEEEEMKHHLTNDQQRCHQAVGLLSIGTFGSSERPRPDEDDDLPEFTMEEAKKLEDALDKLLRRARSKHSARGFDAGAESTSGLPLDRFLNCPSSLEVDRRVQRKREEDCENDGDLSPGTKIILSMAKDLLVNSSGASMKKKSIKVLLKKVFVCGGGGGGFAAPSPTLKDPIETRMDKFFRTVLGKTINVRPPTNGAAASRSCFLEDRPKEMSRSGGQSRRQEEGDSCRWDRTDSEFIVLEI